MHDYQGDIHYLFTIMGFCTFRVLKELKDIYVKHRASTMADAAEMDQFLSLSEQRAALCHVLVTSEPQLGGDQRAHTYGENASVSVEEMILQVWRFLVSYVNSHL